ncbi:transmembrane protein 17 isoform X3 [Cherax quadricarinatus]|uniref:transmembrane protein 17 isoform X3 n=1 Tax=Cherax quadricarinatus TaxID=27406 RepID=UPI00387E613B
MTDSPYCPWCPSQPETVEHFLLWCPRYHCTDCSPCGRTHFWIRNEVVSSLSLQMVIYFSALFFPCWLVTSLVMMTLKFQYVSNLYQFILAAIYFAVPLIEVIRLYIGHVGNLEEKVHSCKPVWGTHIAYMMYTMRMGKVLSAAQSRKNEE